MKILTNKIFIIISTIIVFISIITAANSGLGSSIFSFVKYIPGQDKTAHFILFGVITIIIIIATNYRTVKVYKYNIYWGAILVWFVASFEEVSQVWVDNRSFDFIDLLVDSLGIIVSHLLLKILLSSNRKNT